ncbi:unnamed protein product [Parajaminaea phylloscopi]
MGAQTSKPEQAQSSNAAAQQEKPTLSQSIVSKISSEPAKEVKKGSGQSSAPEVSSPLDLLGPTRQSHLDSNVRSAISSELAKLRKQEAQVQSEIQAKLEKENLAVESKHASKSADSSASASGAGRSSHALQKELDEVRRKISRHDEGRKQVENAPGVKEAREKVVQCYKEQQGRSLDCWAEAKAFTRAVERAEKDFIASLSS